MAGNYVPSQHGDTFTAQQTYHFLFDNREKTEHEGTGRDSLTAFLVRKDFGGIKISENRRMMGIRCAHSVDISFEGVRIPADHVIGSAFLFNSDIGEGFKIAMSTLNYGRFFLGLSMTSIMKRLLKVSFDHATKQSQFGRSLIEIQDIKIKLANMVSDIYSAQEAAWNVCDDTMQILGGHSYMEENGVEKIMRDLRIFRILEGTNDILRQFIFMKENALPKNFKAQKYSNEKISDERKPAMGDYIRKFFQGVNPSIMNDVLDPKKHQIIGRCVVDKNIDSFILKSLLFRVIYDPTKNLQNEIKILNHTHYKMKYNARPTFGLADSLGTTADSIIEMLKESNGNYILTHPSSMID
ncbi:Very long-chain specific acyl-CoA dehydrogenase, mitochondrial [Thelohanellus kitauei]|uniref:Very long-chain specific acyl-CoA dehydrogenase, mitochondrial n=1 Tax=Thelohanellus kitauei TaxID=669202 RepID=A0A0C2MXV4_THEKT|nr:Very long-chain specific acyl-CoA dehydrogenase, mitochondrial [Thelohanellus kitauei]